MRKLKKLKVSIVAGFILFATPAATNAQTDFVSRAELGFAICKIPQRQPNPRITMFLTHYFYAGHHQRHKSTSMQNNTAEINLSNSEAVFAYGLRFGRDIKNSRIEIALEIGYKHPIASTENYSRFYTYFEFIKYTYNLTKRLRLNTSFGMYNELFYSRELDAFNYVYLQWGAGLEFVISKQFDLFAKAGGRHRIFTDFYGRDIMPSHEMQANIGLIYNIRKCDNFRTTTNQPRRRF